MYGENNTEQHSKQPHHEALHPVFQQHRVGDDPVIMQVPGAGEADTSGYPLD